MIHAGRYSRDGLKVLATRDIRSAAVEHWDLMLLMERHEDLSEEEANDLLDVIREARIEATWEDDIA